MGVYRCMDKEVEAFQFYVDYMPDWFYSKVITGTVVLRKCDYKIYNIDEAFCNIKTNKGVIVAFGGDYIINHKTRLIPVNKYVFEKLYKKVK